MGKTENRKSKQVEGTTLLEQLQKQIKEVEDPNDLERLKGTVEEQLQGSKEGITTLDLVIHGEEIKTLEEALTYCKADLSKFQVRKWSLKHYGTPMKIRVPYAGDDKKTYYTEQATKIMNTYVSVEFEPKHPFDPLKFKQAMFDEFKEMMAEENIKYHPPEIIVPKEGLCLATFINDIHLGRQAWAESHGKDFNVKIALDNFRKSFDGLLQQAVKYDIRQNVFMIGHDLFTYDYAHPYTQTTAGTPQNADDRYQKIYRLAIRLAVDSIRKLATIAPVHVMIIPGNHDRQTMFYLGEWVKLFFEGYDDLPTNITIDNGVVVDNQAKYRKYWKWYDNLIGGSHGNREKRGDWHAIVSAEAGELNMWDSTKWRYMYCGHEHHEEEVRITAKHRYRGIKMTVEMNREDYKGLIVDYLPAPSFKDDWEILSGWVGTIASAKAALHHPKYGRIATFNHNISPR